jgi:heme-degrading monooxygenase HmoA
MNAKTSLARVARTPNPPYYAVTTTAELAPGYDKGGHLSLGAQLYREAHEIEGFLGLEVFFEDGASIAASYWASLEAIERWRNHSLHQKAKTIAKAHWFGATITRIARVEADYGFNLK